MRVLAIDYGTVRIGLALSDPMKIVASPLETYRKQDEASDLAYLKHVVDEHEVERIVVGLPRNMDGSEGPQAKLTRTFADKLAAALDDVPVEFWDERLSSAVAERAMLEADLSRKKRKDRRDKVAACVILQGYLQARGTKD